MTDHEPNRATDRSEARTPTDRVAALDLGQRHRLARSVAYTPVFAVAVVAEANLAMLWARRQAMLAPGVNSPFGFGTSVVTGLVVGVRCWGGIPVDLIGRRPLAPLPDSPAARRTLVVLASATMLLILIASVRIGVDRASLPQQSLNAPGPGRAVRKVARPSRPPEDASGRGDVADPAHPRDVVTTNRLAAHAAVAFTTALTRWHGVAALAIFLAGGSKRSTRRFTRTAQNAREGTRSRSEGGFDADPRAHGRPRPSAHRPGARSQVSNRSTTRRRTRNTRDGDGCPSQPVGPLTAGRGGRSAAGHA